MYFRYSLICFLMIGLCLNESCKLIEQQQTKSGAEEAILYPPPPDTARIQFLTSINSTEDLAGKKESRFVTFVTGQKEEVRHIYKPYGIETQKGYIFTSDVGTGGITIVDLLHNNINYFAPQGRGQLVKNINTHIDDSSFLYVADIGRRQIVIFDKKGKYFKSFGDSTDFTPIDVFVYDNKTWVSNMATHKIHVYQNTDTSYNFLYAFPDVAAGDPAFLYQPKNFHIAGDKVYVSDAGSFNVKIFSTDGEYLQTIGSQGVNFGQFTRNKGITVDKEGNIYVVDAAFNNVQIFNDKGQLLIFFGDTDNPEKRLQLPSGITVDYENLQFFEKYVHPDYKLKFLIFVAGQFDGNKINVYGFVELR